MFEIKKDCIVKQIILLIIMILLLITLCGCENNEDGIREEKIEEEVLYMDSIIFEIMDNFVKGNYFEKVSNISEENIVEEIERIIINYEKIKDDVKKVNTSLDVTIIDLSNEDVNVNIINSLSDNINNLIINSSTDDINIILESLKNLDTSILDVYNQIDISENKKILRRVKSQVLDVLVSSIIYKDKSISKEKINALLSEYSEKIKDTKFLEENSYISNNIYVLIQELKKAVDLENEELIKLKYLSLIEML